MLRYIILLGIFSSDLCYAVDVIAHRGNACGFPDNSIAAIRSAWFLGADGVELDLRISSDNVLFLYHDDTFDGAQLTSLKYAKIAERLGDVAPSLGSLFAEGEPPGYYIVDLKELGRAFAETLVDFVLDSGFSPQRLMFQGENLAVLEFIARKIPDSKTLYLVRLPRKFPFGKKTNPEVLLAQLKWSSVNGVSLKGRSYLDSQYVMALKEQGLLVNVWTINNPLRAEFYQNIGVDGLITDEVFKIKSRVTTDKSYVGECPKNMLGAG